MAYDVTRIRKDFPSLESGIAYFDGPGGSQVPRVVGEVIARAITQPSSNRGVVTESEINADNYVKGYRNSVADLLNCDPRGEVGPSSPMTSREPSQRAGTKAMKLSSHSSITIQIFDLGFKRQRQGV
jgi:selenocysteine lyase/cysteine desulfurase